MKNYILAGASSNMAVETAKTLQNEGNHVTGISTKPQQYQYNDYHLVADYGFGKFPVLDSTINGLVYYPGTITLKPVKSISEADLINDYRINCMGAVAFIRQYLPNMKQSTEVGSIVLISSVAAQTGMAYHTSVAMVKGAIESLTRTLAAELAPGIRVNCVAPSLTATTLSERLINTPEKMEAAMKNNPMKRIGKAVDIAHAVSYLLSVNASMITGQVLSVDGGMGTLRAL
jgi:NAD(P)-dependent dehydrogenase (short-subunit alcohol dehydrogenase family)